MDRQIVHMDLDAFYVSCTLLKMPELAGRPLIIGGTSNRGVVTSASNECDHFLFVCWWPVTKTHPHAAKPDR